MGIFKINNINGTFAVNRLIAKKMEATQTNNKTTESELILYSGERSLYENSHKYGKGYFKMIMKLLSETPEQPSIPTSWKRLHKKYLDGKITELEAINVLDNWLYSTIRKDENFDWDIIDGPLGRNQQAHLIEEFKDSISDEVYWKLVSRCYVNSDFSFESSEYIASLLFVDRPNSELMMNEEEREFFNALPDMVQIYRGCSLKEIESGAFRFSWTLSKKVANFFAFEYNRNLNTNCDVVEKTVPKSQLLAYFNEREEEEILYVAPHLSSPINRE